MWGLKASIETRADACVQVQGRSRLQVGRRVFRKNPSRCCGEQDGTQKVKRLENRCTRERSKPIEIWFYPKKPGDPSRPVLGCIWKLKLKGSPGSRSAECDPPCPLVKPLYVLPHYRQIQTKTAPEITTPSEAPSCLDPLDFPEQKASTGH